MTLFDLWFINVLKNDEKNALLHCLLFKKMTGTLIYKKATHIDDTFQSFFFFFDTLINRKKLIRYVNQQ